MPKNSASHEYCCLLYRHGAACSMSAAGNGYDNAVVESAFATRKMERLPDCGFETRSEACDVISNYIENYYTSQRRHSAVGNLLPINSKVANSDQLAVQSRTSLRNCGNFTLTVGSNDDA